MSATETPQLNEARELLTELASATPTSVCGRALSDRSKLPFKAASLWGALGHRVVELGRVACDLYEHRHTVAAILLTRAAMEAIAWLLILHDCLEECLEQGQIGDIDEFLMNLLFANRTYSTEYRARSVLSAVDRVDRDVPGFRAMYDVFSEIAHPNYAGVLKSFGNLDRSQASLNLDVARHQIEPEGGFPILSASLHILNPRYAEIPRLIERFARMCERELESGERPG